MRKYEAVDLMKLYSLGSNNGWNDMLTDCQNKRDINRLARLKYQIQAGMDDLAKNRLNSSEMSMWFLRLIRSIDLTAKKIIKLRNPFPQDNPLIAKDYVYLSALKTKRDQELMAFLAKSSY